MRGVSGHASQPNEHKDSAGKLQATDRVEGLDVGDVQVCVEDWRHLWSWRRWTLDSDGRATERARAGSQRRPPSSTSPLHPFLLTLTQDCSAWSRTEEVSLFDRWTGAVASRPKC